MLLSLWLPIVLCAVALFFASFLSWMVLQLHWKDWNKVPNEVELMAAARPLPPGNYMFPYAGSMTEMQTPEFQAKIEAGPRGIMTILPKIEMWKNLVPTIIFFLVVSAVLAYLGTIGLPANPGFLLVFRFMATAGLLTFLSATIQHAIWFPQRIVGHVIESILYALIVGLIFASLWPSA